MDLAKSRSFYLYLKALIWSVFVSYEDSTVHLIARCIREGNTGESYAEFRDSHLGDGLRVILQHLTDQQERDRLADCLEKVKQSEAAMVYRNMVIEVGHYVTAKEGIGDVKEDDYGVIYCLDSSRIWVLFRTEEGKLVDTEVFPFQIMPVYTLTIPDSLT